MKSSKSPPKKSLVELLFHKIGHTLFSESRYFPVLAEWALIVWKLVGILGILVGIFLILKSMLLVAMWYIAIPDVLLESLNRMFSFFWPFFWYLMVASLHYLWQPIIIYIIITLLTKSELWRKFWCLTALAVFFLAFASHIETMNWKDYRVAPLLLLQMYVFLLWILPHEAWNIAGLVITSILGLIILIVPDLPTAFDDFGLFGAILAFFLGYLNALSSLVQRIARRI